MAPAGPPIRYRTAIELVDAPSAFDTAQLTRDLLASSLVRTWLDRVQPPGGGLSHYHSSQPEAFENAASKLCDLGLRAGMAPLDARMSPYLTWLSDQAGTCEEASTPPDSTQGRTREETEAATASRRAT
jgi:hypothetical protein